LGFRFGNLLAGGSVPAGRAVVSHFRLAAAPAAIASFAAPKHRKPWPFTAAEEEISAPIPVANPVPPTSLGRAKENSDRATLPDFR